MKVMAARMAEHSKDINTSIALWQAIYETTHDKDVKETSELHLTSLLAERDISELEKRVQTYRQRMGAFPTSWADLIQAGLIPGIPLAPKQEPYVLKPGGKVDVQDASQYRYLGEWRGDGDLPF
jgi:hypothetical protein